jgi:Uma2 family endonuclease
MAGGSERHDLAAGLVYEALAPGARAAGCRPLIANRLVRLGAAAYYPDVLVVCGPAAHRLYETAVTVAVEVLTPSTADVDRREKAAAYSTAPSLAGYLLVDPERSRIEVAVRTPDGLRWAAYGPGSVVVLAYGVLDVDSLFGALDLTATT